jgi:hypothetical protein
MKLEIRREGREEMKEGRSVKGDDHNKKSI